MPFPRLIPGAEAFAAIPLPTVLCDGEFAPCWSNSRARALWPEDGGAAALAAALSGYSHEEIRRRLSDDGCLALSDTTLRLSVAVLPHPGDKIGAVAFLLPEPALSAAALVPLLRESASEIFSGLDSVFAKAELLGAGWLAPSLNAAGAASYRLLRAAANITEYDNLTSGTAIISMETLDLTGVLADMRDIVVGVGGGMDIPVEFSLPGTPLPVYGDRRLLELAIVNIFHNSFYYTRPGNAVKARLTRKTGTRLSLDISDRGLGIPEALLERLRQQDENAGGLGLKLTRRITRLHGGEEDIVSAEGEGTTVTLLLPIAGPTRPLRLAGRDNDTLPDRFSRVYSGLADAAVSPHIGNRK